MDCGRGLGPAALPAATKSGSACWPDMTGLGGYLLAALDSLFKRLTGNERLL
ncbi:hypothetical protein [Bacteriophage sp. 438212]|nr:hypothetical protein [Bacteriophage sp. 438212]